MYPQRLPSGAMMPGSQQHILQIHMTPSNSPQDLQLPPVPGLDDPFVSGATQQRDHGPSVFGPDFSFDVMDPTSPVNLQGPREEPSYPYLGGHQSSEHIGFTTYHGSSNGDQLSYDHKPNTQGLNVVIVQLTANIKHLSEAKTSMEEELTHIKGKNNSLALCLESINETLGELQESIGQQKQTPSRTNSNHHAVLKSIIQLLFSQFCGVDCDGTRKKCTVALAVVKPLGDKQPYELTDKGMQIWHPDWLDKVNDEINTKFIKELAKCAFNNEKVLYTAQREQTQLKSIPDKSFSMTIIIDSQHVTVAAAQCKAALLYEQESGNQGMAALILTNLGSNILTCNDNEVNAKVRQSANKVVGHAWQSIDYVTFLHWLSLHAMKQQQDANDEPDLRQVGQEPQHKQHRTTKKLHKCVFNIGPKHLSRYLPQAKAMVFKAMVDDRWYDEHLDMVVHEGIDWLKGFYSHINTEDLFEADMTYLKELDDCSKQRHWGLVDLKYLEDFFITICRFCRYLTWYSDVNKQSPMCTNCS
ncbi:hypothetical protein V8B97DRAFT_2020554 [Scleroderma yunnanense]